MGDRAAEIAQARTAAPASISGAAEVMVLGRSGYVKAEGGKNGFVCLVQRAWFSGLKDPGFWNPKLRAPICFNPQAARSVLPALMARTRWAMAGASQEQILTRTRSAMAAGKIPPPAAGAMTFMLSKEAYLGDGPHGPWRPHVMFFMPPSVATASWGVGAEGSPVFGASAGIDPWTMFYVPVATWSDGTPDEASEAKHKM
ncbi:MAG: hypothetical protein E7812_03890 [Phenylobacterium sp.]|nr:MAG: hypothetical protein E7812_03890 [Phenylobacterium sp.]